MGENRGDQTQFVQMKAKVERALGLRYFTFHHHGSGQETLQASLLSDLALTTLESTLDPLQGLAVEQL